MSENHRTTEAKVIAEMNIHLEESVSIKIVRRELHKSHIHSTVEIAEPLITETTQNVDKDGVVTTKSERLMIGKKQYSQMRCSSRYAQQHA